MPVMPGYTFADTPHPSTVKDSSYTYGCHSNVTGPQPRGGATAYPAHCWSADGPRIIRTTWLPKPCGHSTRTADPACRGCTNQHLPDNT